MVMMVKRGLMEANLTMSDVHEIVFVGGSAHIPMVRQQFKDFFAGKEVARSIDPAEVVVHGAAIVGEIINRADCESVSQAWSFYEVPWPYCLQRWRVSVDEYLKEYWKNITDRVSNLNTMSVKIILLAWLRLSS